MIAMIFAVNSTCCCLCPLNGNRRRSRRFQTEADAEAERSAQFRQVNDTAEITAQHIETKAQHMLLMPSKKQLKFCKTFKTSSQHNWITLIFLQFLDLGPFQGVLERI